MTDMLIWQVDWWRGTKSCAVREAAWGTMKKVIRDKMLGHILSICTDIEHMTFVQSKRELDVDVS